MTYNFFNHLNLEINTNGHNGYDKYFENEYLRITDNAKITKGSPTISVNIVKNMPKLKNSIKRNVQYKKLFSYTYMVEGLETNNVVIYFKRHLIDRLYMNAIGVFLQAQVIEPIMYLKLLENDVLFMHAGGVANNKNGYLFPAYGGTGKTTFSIALLNQGYKLLGDDLLFVSIKEKLVYPYPRPMHIFTYNINNLNGAKISMRYRVIVYFKNIIRFFLERLLHNEFLISTRIHADEVFEGSPFGHTVPYKAMFFLKKDGPATEIKKIDQKNRSSIALEIMNSEDLNDSLYELVADEDTVSNIKDLEKEVIVSLLNQFDRITYLNTRKLDLKDLSSFIKKYF